MIKPFDVLVENQSCRHCPDHMCTLGRPRRNHGIPGSERTHLRDVTQRMHNEPLTDTQVDDNLRE